VTLGTLRKVVAYVEGARGRIGRAAVAKTLGMSDEALGKLVNLVEARLDVVLADRDRDADDRLVPGAEEFVAAATKLLQDYDALLSPQKFGVRRVRIGTYPSVASSLVARRVLPALLASEPGQNREVKPGPFPARFKLYRLETATSGRAQIVREVERGALDFGIIDRDAAQAAGPTASGFEWSPLFVSSPGGFLYHRDNAAFAELAAEAERFNLDRLRSHTLVLNEADSRAVRDSLIADPFLGVATRCHLTTYGQVYEAVAANAGVGIGFEPKDATSDGPVRFLAFSAIRCPSARDQETVGRLAARGVSTFGLYLPTGWDRPRAAGGLTPAAKFVLGVVRSHAGDYTHDYVS
jgi:DNA-binding transcriptional LysR family regulator